MEKGVIERLKWRMAKWLWAPPKGMPVSDQAYAEWMKPMGEPIGNERRRILLREKRKAMVRTKRIDKLNYRGSRSHREAGPRHPRKAVLPFRGKGAKTERRSARSRRRRKVR